MSKVKKKRTKKYSGQDIAARPSVTHVTAVKRNKLQLWWLDRRRLMKPVIITGGVLLIVAWLVVELVRVANGGGL